MYLSLIFRGVLTSGFLFAAWRWGDWRNWQKYYSSMLFVMVVNLSAGYISYHHPLWVFSDDILVTTETAVEFVNTYIVLTTTTLIYLTNFPTSGAGKKIAYILFWVLIYGTLEFIDNKIIGGISYANGWMWIYSVLFDLDMFLIIRTHYVRPLWGWAMTIVTAIYILITFGFFSAEMK